MGVPGVEPGTSSLSGTRSNQLSYTPKREIRISNIEIRNMRFRVSNFVHQFPARGAGGGEQGVRTPDPELTKLVLFQLSYAPSKRAAIRMTYAVFGPEAARRASACDELPMGCPIGRSPPSAFAGGGDCPLLVLHFEFRYSEFRNAGLGYSLERR